MKKLIAAMLLALICWAVPIKYVWAKTTEKKVEIQTQPTIKYLPKDNAIQRPTNISLKTKPAPAEVGTLRHEAQSSLSCETYREIVSKYFGVHTDQALFVASKESGCRIEAVSRTSDYCLFQIHKEPLTLNDVDLCVRRAWEKFVAGRVGDNNWSAWYAVCTPGNNPQPKYPNIKCQ